MAGSYPSCLAVAGYDGLLRSWAGLSATAWLDEVNRLAAARGLRSDGGAPIRFELAPPGQVRLSALAYERRVHDEGRVTCRRDGDGLEHDQWNAAVWLAWPRTKAALNAIHARERGGDRASGEGQPFRHGSMPGPGPAPGRRSRARDFATLLDESGLAWLSRRPHCDALLRERCWRALFVDARDDVIDGVIPIVIGHGLIGKLRRPYKRLTAQALLVPVDADAFAGMADCVDAGLIADERIACRVKAVAERLGQDAGAPGPGGSPGRDGNPRSSRNHGPARAGDPARRASPCVPLPVLALPGWCDQNRRPGFYDDPAVFRPRHAGRAAGGSFTGSGRTVEQTPG